MPNGTATRRSIRSWPLWESPISRKAACLHTDINTTTSAEGARVGLVVSRYHDDITGALRDGAIELYHRGGGRPEDLIEIWGPGTFELPVLAKALADRGDLDGVVALGCVIRGETSHFEYICQAAASGLTQISISTGKPVAFGVLTCDTTDEARERAGGERGNKGAEAMAAVIESIHAIRSLHQPEV